MVFMMSCPDSLKMKSFTKSGGSSMCPVRTFLNSSVSSRDGRLPNSSR